MLGANELETLAVDVSFIAVRLAEHLKAFWAFRLDPRAERRLRFCLGKATINVTRCPGHRHFMTT